MTVPTTDQIRDSIDKGLAGDTVAMPDPAAAPLGTDAEASGNAPTVEERAMDVAATPKWVRVPQTPWLGLYVYLGAMIAIGAVAVWIVVAASA